MKSLLACLTVLLFVGWSLQQCCQKQQIAGEMYDFVKTSADATQPPFNCKDDCIYSKAGNASVKYCLANGDLEAQCMDSDTTGAPTNSTTSKFNNAAYCDVDTQHTMCKYPGVAPTCGDERIFRELSEDAKTAILLEHNNLRSKVARGLEDGQPQAANMRKMEWDEELEMIAQRWTDQCTFGHDAKRNLLDGTYVGQNAYISYYSLLENQDTVQAKYPEKGTRAWYNEVTTPGFDPANIEPYKFSSGVGHYTQIVWAESDRLGCGITYFKDGSWYKTLVVCNYAKGGNFIGSSMYKQGAPCSQCPTSHAKCEDGLCAK